MRRKVIIREVIGVLEIYICSNRGFRCSGRRLATGDPFLLRCELLNCWYDLSQICIEKCKILYALGIDIRSNKGFGCSTRLILLCCRRLLISELNVQVCSLCLGYNSFTCNCLQGWTLTYGSEKRYSDNQTGNHRSAFVLAILHPKGELDVWLTGI